MDKVNWTKSGAAGRDAAGFGELRPDECRAVGFGIAGGLLAVAMMFAAAVIVVDVGPVAATTHVAMLASR
jgi:hypothetical protein